MRIVNVYTQKGRSTVCVEEWNGKQYRNNRYYQASQASLDRLSLTVRIWQKQGKILVRPFLGGHIGYVAEEQPK